MRTTVLSIFLVTTLLTLFHPSFGLDSNELIFQEVIGNLLSTGELDGVPQVGMMPMDPLNFVGKTITYVWYTTNYMTVNISGTLFGASDFNSTGFYSHYEADKDLLDISFNAHHKRIEIDGIYNMYGFVGGTGNISSEGLFKLTADTGERSEIYQVNISDPYVVVPKSVSITLGNAVVTMTDDKYSFARYVSGLYNDLFGMFMDRETQILQQYAQYIRSNDSNLMFPYLVETLSDAETLGLPIGGIVPIRSRDFKNYEVQLSLDAPGTSDLFLNVSGAIVGASVFQPSDYRMSVTGKLVTFEFLAHFGPVEVKGIYEATGTLNGTDIGGTVGTVRVNVDGGIRKQSYTVDISTKDYVIKQSTWSVKQVSNYSVEISDFPDWVSQVAQQQQSLDYFYVFKNTEIEFVQSYINFLNV